MKHQTPVLTLPFAGMETVKTNGAIQSKLTELKAEKEALEADCKKLHPNHTKLFIHFKGECLDKQIALLEWVLNEVR